MKMVSNIFFLTFSLLIPKKIFYAKLCFFSGIYGKLEMITASSEELGLHFRFNMHLQHIFKPTYQLGRSINGRLKHQSQSRPLLFTNLIQQSL
jgi:hypothetical protein